MKGAEGYSERQNDLHLEKNDENKNVASFDSFDSLFCCYKSI